MPIGNISKRNSSAERGSRGGGEVRAVALRFTNGRVTVALSDQREVSVPLAWYPTLRKATSSQRARWQLIGKGEAFHWPDLDLDLSLAGLIQGLPECVPAPPPRGNVISAVSTRVRKSA